MNSWEKLAVDWPNLWRTTFSNVSRDAILRRPANDLHDLCTLLSDTLVFLANDEIGPTSGNTKTLLLHLIAWHLWGMESALVSGRNLASDRFRRTIRTLEELVPRLNHIKLQLQHQGQDPVFSSQSPQLPENQLLELLMTLVREHTPSPSQPTPIRSTISLFKSTNLYQSIVTNQQTIALPRVIFMSETNNIIAASSAFYRFCPDLNKALKLARRSRFPAEALGTIETLGVQLGRRFEDIKRFMYKRDESFRKRAGLDTETESFPSGVTKDEFDMIQNLFAADVMGFTSDVPPIVVPNEMDHSGEVAVSLHGGGKKFLESIAMCLKCRTIYLWIIQDPGDKREVKLALYDAGSCAEDLAQAIYSTLTS